MDFQIAQAVPLIVVLGCGALAAVSDIRTMRVRNALTVPLIFGGILFHAVTPLGNGWAFGLGGASVGFLLLFVLFLLGGIGAGDVKLLTGVGAWLGPSAVFFVFLAAGLLAGFVSLVIVVKGRSFSETWHRFRVMWFQVVSLSKYVAADDNVEVACNNSRERHRLIPFGAVIFVATIAVALVIVLAR
ncbi:MAG TPA: A24 family peptidase [Candidatus Anammoximicrobium sp.]|nr:A24 family peptidase [Candidatus Anammoximicrobium sp.]